MILLTLVRENTDYRHTMHRRWFTYNEHLHYSLAQHAPNSNPKRRQWRMSLYCCGKCTIKWSIYVPSSYWTLIWQIGVASGSDSIHHQHQGHQTILGLLVIASLLENPVDITVVSILCSRENSISGIEIHTSSRFLRVITFLRRSFSCSSTSWIPTRLLKSLRFCKIERISFQDIHERLYNQKCILALLHRIRCQSAFCYCSGVASSPFS